MDANAAVSALSALAHAGRLEVFRLLVRAGKAGMASGEIARATVQRMLDKPGSREFVV